MESEQDIEAQFLGDYKILCRKGQSLWSEDLLAEHRFIKKRYFIRLLLPDLGSSQTFMEAFRDVVIKLAKLNQPGILTIENVSEASGRYFLVTQGQDVPMLSLTQYLKSLSRQLREIEIVDLISQLATLLDYAHSEGLYQEEWNLDSIHIRISEGVPIVVLPDLGFISLLKERILQSLFTDHKNGEARIKERILLHPTEGKHGDTYAFGAITYYLLFGFLPQGIFPMPSKTYSQYVYDWDFLLLSSLSYFEENRAKELLPLIRKKSSGEQLQNVVSNCLETSLREIAEPLDMPEKLPELILKESEFQITQQKKECVEHLEFVLVEACSIDKAMDTAIEPVGSSGIEEVGYSQALQSLLVREPVVSRYIEAEKEEPKPQPILTEMVLIEGGEFSRGSVEGQRDELPVHKVILNSFFLDIHPVTNEQFIRYLESCGSEQDRHYNELIRLRDSRIQRRSGKLIIEPGYVKHPVVGVTWYGASGYAEWVGKRLPTEAEWEIAASGGLASLRYPCGEEIEKSRANFFTADTTAVMSYPPNPYGLYDMAGNVYEWCQDWYGYDFYEISSQEPQSPQGPAQGVYRVLRGGCWKSLKDDLRCAHRHRNNPGAVNSTYGFRCARNIH
ncbi:Serine/threonine-protein kinase pkn1,Predicted NTPase (NACHT family),aerobic sulfatase maturase family protein,Formylglycine-generating sulfatase enzyme [Chlamydia serpentis]|uniref:non-specific serine/threonine protein kinase n=1 Tax=Chlamydia serpentis TaxID=1967782 RepID=A0A2R8FA62_9CHLA|nr:SUMF1/EgtB/PvdO family nonheme iron enzyme [Chlamydia serpentis]SPN73309.1 Serine/threonine-protein kinase pkn1,Predicted NTPase (NACHT family),aerobic sulfatase maturase family protein,Formylglycine-generating sulfatase enzyme [Chlamydia serpentis]